MDIRQLIQLKLGGKSNRKIAALTGIHRNSVNAYVQQLEACGKPLETLLALSDAELDVFFPVMARFKKTATKA